MQTGESKLAGVEFTAGRDRDRGRGMCCLHVSSKPDTSSSCSHTTAIPRNTAGPVLMPELPSSDIPPQTLQKRWLLQRLPLQGGLCPAWSEGQEVQFLSWNDCAFPFLLARPGTCTSCPPPTQHPHGSAGQWDKGDLFSPRKLTGGRCE